MRLNFLNYIQKRIVLKILSSNSYYHPLYMHALSELHSWKWEDIHMYQLYRIRRLLRDSHQKVSYWRDLIDTKLGRDKAPDIKDFAYLPILTRETLANRSSELYNDCIGSRKYSTFVTSGSTGQPQMFAGDRIFFQKIMATEEFYVHFWGNKNFRQHGFMLHKPHLADLTTQIPPVARDSDIVPLKSFLKNNRIRTLVGPVFSLNFLAKKIEAGELHTNFQFIMSCSEHLDTKTRQYLKDIFRCPIYDKYSCTETGIIGVECTDKGDFHIDPANFYLEIIDDNDLPIVKSDNTGRIIITIFNNYLMPLIRYEMGDMGSWVNGECRCGLQTPRISFDGRKSDYLKFGNGSSCPVLGIIRAVDFEFVDIIAKQQITQKSLNKIIFSFVPGKKYHNRHRREIYNFIKKIMCDFPDIDLEVREEQILNNFKNGKYICFKSEINLRTASSVISNVKM